LFCVSKRKGVAVLCLRFSESTGSALDGLLPEPVFSLNLRPQFDLRVFEGKNPLLQLQLHSMLFPVVIKAISAGGEIKASRNTPFIPLTNGATPFFGAV
jgi:hypothetical protein